MNQPYKLWIALGIGMAIGLSSCTTSRTKTLAQVSSLAKSDNSPLKIFLLERDIPQDIEQLGVVTIRPRFNNGLNMDVHVKQQLRKECERLGANGAYRTQDGTYAPQLVSYLVFKYKK
ncbi:hypothetical protein BWI93_15390 [Siphonobacter sp. BAB-5385]|uniref:hypothetical protein n=1 Tax=Siphonobacter sp. BAB-5385 TaxID=1864822 RepID=UPI000B9E370E|nr:hypothetical protein [Siphonobacter sp. BAB-5385]OZI07395.1 hypothetical protein BWI93_15390 [Siphonobacter sp. BAB-5385]